MERDRIDDLALNLRLIAQLHAVGISDSERDDLRATARLLEQLHTVGTELVAALEGVLDDGSIAHSAAFTALSHWHHFDQAVSRG